MAGCRICGCELSKENHTVSYDDICDKCATAGARSLYW